MIWILLVFDCRVCRVVLLVWIRSRLDAWRIIFFFQAEDGIRGLVRSRGLGDVYKRQACHSVFRRLLRLETLERRQLLAADLLFADSFEVGLSLIHI